MLLTINNLKVNYGSTLALDISSPIVINEGDKIGIIGSNGAGKSTLLKAILGIIQYKGSIKSSLRPEDIAVHMQFNEYTDSMPVRYIMEAVLDTSIRSDKKLSELIDYFDFRKCLNKRYKNLSGGQKQRFTIILVMMQNSPLTFYDEVTSGLDFETRQKLVEKLVDWYRGSDAGLMVVSHYYEELEQLTDKLMILDNGHLIDFGRQDELFHKYCGNSIIITDNTPSNDELLKDYRRLISPSHLIALCCDNTEIEQELSNILINNNVNYKRSNNDIEIMYINAKACYEKRCMDNE